jgi:signal transduction histidine kinase
MSATILNVDDHEAGRYAISRILSKAGFNVLEAATGTDALHLVRTAHPDLILLDVNLPDATGFDVCNQLKSDRETSTIPILMISASLVGVGPQIQGLLGGADGYLSEPVEPEVLLAHITALLRMREAERRAERARQESEAANRAKDQFLAVLSHELRTPLNPILTAVSILPDMDLPEEARPLVDIIHRNALLEARLIDDLLDLTRIAKGKLQMQFGHVDVHALLMDVVAICDADIEQKDLRLTMDLRAKGTAVEADTARLQQVIWNVLKNSVKFTDPGGTIAITTENSDPGAIRIAIRDTGIGIEEHLLDKIFDAFDQGAESTNRTFGGLGLGLAISKSIVQAHNGLLTASSAGRGHGSTFTIELNTTDGD